MVLRMARPSKRPESSAFQFRKRVPPDVLALIGGPVEVKVSLRTSDSAEAKRIFRQIEEQHEARWTQVRLGIQDLDDRQVAALAGEVYREAIRKAGNDRDAGAWQPWSVLKARCEVIDREEHAMSEPQLMWELNQLHGASVDEVIGRRGMRLSEDTLGRLLIAAHRETKNAINVVYRQACGDWSPDANLKRFPNVEVVSPTDPNHQFEAVWGAWRKNVKPSANTVRRWKPALDRMVAALGTSDLSKVTDTMLIEWTDNLLDTLHNNTVSKVHLAAAKAIFAFAKRKRIILVDPAAGVMVDSGADFETDMRSFEPDEALTVLRATLAPPSKKASAAFSDARRWVPWICAYTGARVNEITQARACDFSVHTGLTILSITPEAGTAKTGKRKVPLHPDLIDQGFGAFLATKSGEQPLFYVPRQERTSTVPAYEEMGARIGKWVRRLGIKDKRLDPNHAWRHRFKGYSAKAGNDERVTDALQGHAPNTQGRKYGEVDLEERVTAILKLPRIVID